MFEFWQLVEQRPRKRRAFAHYHDDLKILQALGDRIFVSQMVVEHCDFDVARQRRPVGHFHRNVLIIVENCQFFHLIPISFSMRALTSRFARGPALLSPKSKQLYWP